jgi:hypothetical protein
MVVYVSGDVIGKGCRVQFSVPLTYIFQNIYYYYYYYYYFDRPKKRHQFSRTRASFSHLQQRFCSVVHMQQNLAMHYYSGSRDIISM